MQLYLEAKEDTSARPGELRGKVKRIVKWWGDKTVSEIKGPTCRQFAKERSSATAARRELELLRAAVRLYAKEHGLDVTPQFTFPPNNPPRERWLTRSEAARLLWTAYRSRYQKHLVRLILIGLYTGTRHSAILGLQWMPNTTGGWVDLEKGVMFRRGVGVRETKKRQTPTRLSGRLVQHLRRWRVQDQGCRHIVRYEGRSIRRIENAFRSLRVMAGLDEEVKIHSLRHTRATWLAQAGVPIWEAAGSLGMTPQTFEKHYGHQSPDFQKRAAEAY